MRTRGLRLDLDGTPYVGAGLVALQKKRYWSLGTGPPSMRDRSSPPWSARAGRRVTILGKPQADFFRRALEDMNREAGEVTMVGDDPDYDVATSRAARRMWP